MGKPIEKLDTPALLLNGPTCDRNLRKMVDFFRDKTCRLRPHFKNHKCTRLARRQLDAGLAVGITCAKLSEAQILVDHGFDDILIANQVVGSTKVQRLVDLAKRATVRVAIDEFGQALAISQIAAPVGVKVPVLIEIDIGMGRCGVPPGQPTLELAKQLVPLDGIEFFGIQAFEGHAVYIDDAEQRSQTVRRDMQAAIKTRRLLEHHGIKVTAISGGASATHATTGAMVGIDELQCGTYATMDWRYHELVPDFEIAMSVLTTVISRPKPAVAVLDVGVKGMGDEFGPPRVKGHPTVQIPFWGSEEHTVLHHVPNWRVGEKVQLVPSHACTTSNLYSQIHVHDDQGVVDVWPIEGAGHAQ